MEVRERSSRARRPPLAAASLRGPACLDVDAGDLQRDRQAQTPFLHRARHGQIVAASARAKPGRNTRTVIVDDDRGRRIVHDIEAEYISYRC